MAFEKALVLVGWANHLIALEDGAQISPVISGVVN